MAVSGQFLIDSEASMRGVTGRMAAGGGERAISNAAGAGTRGHRHDHTALATGE